jgi:hypothetical protein
MRHFASSLSSCVIWTEFTVSFSNKRVVLPQLFEVPTDKILSAFGPRHTFPLYSVDSTTTFINLIASNVRCGCHNFSYVLPSRLISCGGHKQRLTCAVASFGYVYSRHAKIRCNFSLRKRQQLYTSDVSMGSSGFTIFSFSKKKTLQFYSLTSHPILT